MAGNFRRYLFGTALSGALCALAAAADEIVLEEGDAVMTAPDNISCSEPPLLSLKGDLGALFGDDRGLVNRLSAAMGQGFSQACPDVDELSVEGSDGDVEFRFVLRKEAGWKLPVPAPKAEDVPKGAAAPAATAAADEAPGEAATAQPAGMVVPGKLAGALGGAPEAAAPVEEEPVVAEPPPEPEVAPGLSFSQLAQFYGPVPVIRGHAKLESHDTWNRIMAARAYSYRPSIINDDMLALELAAAMLSPVEMQQVLGPLAQQVQPYNNNYRFENLNVFDRRDLANRIRTQLKPYLDQRRQTGPIDVYHVAQVQLGEYRLDAGVFPFNGHGHHFRSYRAPAWKRFQLSGALDGVVFPKELPYNEAQARQLDNYLRARKDRRLYLGAFLTVDPRPQDSITQGQPLPVAATVKQVALFADETMTQMVADLTAFLAPQQAEVARVTKELSQPTVNGERLVRALAVINGSNAPVKAAVDAYSLFSGLGEGEKLARREEALQALNSVPGRKTMRFQGMLRLRPYDPFLKGIPVDNVQIQHRQFEGFGLSLQLQSTFFPQITVLPMSEAEAARIASSSQSSNYLEMRLDAEMIQGSHVAPSREYLEAVATFRPKRLLLFSGHQGGIPAERRLLADIAFPETAGGEALPFEVIKLGD